MQINIVCKQQSIGGERVKRKQEIELIVLELRKYEEFTKIDAERMRLAVKSALKKVRDEKFLEKQKRRRY